MIAFLLVAAETVEAVAEQITLDSFVVLVVLGTLLPLLNGLVMKASASKLVKQLVALTTSAIAGFLNAAITVDGGASFTKVALILAILTWLNQMLAYLGIYKPVEINERLAPEKGLG